MATNRELKAEIETLSQRLGVSSETDRLNRDALTKLVEELREKVSAREAGGAETAQPVEVSAPVESPPPSEREAGTSLFGATKRASPTPPPEVVVSAVAEVAPPAEPSAIEAPPAEEEAAPSAPASGDPGQPPRFYRVAQGCVIYTNKGKLGAFKRIAARDLSGGQEMLDELVRSGQVEARR